MTEVLSGESVRSIFGGFLKRHSLGNCISIKFGENPGNALNMVAESKTVANIWMRGLRKLILNKGTFNFRFKFLHNNLTTDIKKRRVTDKIVTFLFGKKGKPEFSAEHSSWRRDSNSIQIWHPTIAVIRHDQAPITIFLFFRQHRGGRSIQRAISFKHLLAKGREEGGRTKIGNTGFAMFRYTRIPKKGKNRKCDRAS